MEHVLNFHLGDNASFKFPDSVYIGLIASLPVRIINLSPTPAPLQLTVRTSNLETLSAQQLHRVSLDDFEVGQLGDPNSGSDNETHTFELRRDLIHVGEPQRITVEVVGRLPQLEDDFVLRSLELAGGELQMGWA